MKGQSESAQKERIQKGLCPIHGCCMGQVGNVRHILTGRIYPVQECCRQDCEQTLFKIGKRYIRPQAGYVDA